MARRTTTMLAFLLAPALAHAAPVRGDACSDPMQESDDGRLQCLPTYDEHGDPVYLEYEGQILNGRRGEAVLSAGCGVIGKLLGTLGQSYSHTGMLIEDRYEIRHSTSAEGRILDYPEGNLVGIDIGEPIDGLQADTLHYQWPGVISQPTVGA